MGPKTVELCEKLREASALLKSAGEQHWASWLDKSLTRIERRDLSGVDHLLGAYGGMGSFNDLILMSANGHSVTDESNRDVNDRLDTLRTKLYELARDVRRNAVIDE
jgi:hypothetical protein